MCLYFFLANQIQNTPDRADHDTRLCFQLFQLSADACRTDEKDTACLDARILLQKLRLMIDLRRQLMGELACEALLGNSSPLYARLYSEGLINKNFGYGFELYPGCALMAAGGESCDPRAVRDAVLAEGARIAQEGVDEGLFRRLKKGVYGAKVRGLNSFENVCIELAQAHFAGVEYLTFPEVFDGISKADVEDCIRRWVTPERCGLAVVRPGEEA